MTPPRRPGARPAAPPRRRDVGLRSGSRPRERAPVTVDARGRRPGRRRTFAVHGHHYALVERRAASSRARRDAVHRRGRRRAGLAAGRARRSRPPVDRHARRRASRCGWRSARAARRSRTTRRATARHGVDALRAYALRDGRRSTDGPTTRPRPSRAGPTWCSSSATRSTPTRPPTRCSEFIESPARHRAAAVDRAQGLRGVRPPLLARVVRPGQPLAALDAADAR